MKCHKPCNYLAITVIYKMRTLKLEVSSVYLTTSRCTCSLIKNSGNIY